MYLVIGKKIEVRDVHIYIFIVELSSNRIKIYYCCPSFLCNKELLQTDQIRNKML